MSGLPAHDIPYSAEQTNWSKQSQLVAESSASPNLVTGCVRMVEVMK